MCPIMFEFLSSYSNADMADDVGYDRVSKGHLL